MKSWGDAVLQGAEQLFREGRIDEARPLLIDFVQKDPASARGWWLLSMALSDTKQQIDCLERVLRIDPKNAAARTRLGKLKGEPTPRPHSASFETSPAITQEPPRTIAPFVPAEKDILPPTTSLAKPAPAKKRAGWVLPVSILAVFICAASGIVGLMLVLRARQPAPLPPTQSLPTLGLPPTWTPTITLTPLPTRTFVPGLSTPDLISTLAATDIPNSTMGIASGLDAPDFSLVDVNNGDQINLSDYRGHPVILFFIFSTPSCNYCETEAPALQKIYENYHDVGLVVLGIDESCMCVGKGTAFEGARTFHNKNGLTFPVLIDEDSVVFKKYKGTAFPTNYFIDTDGKVSTFVRGMLDYSTLNIKVRVLLNMIPTLVP